MPNSNVAMRKLTSFLSGFSESRRIAYALGCATLLPLASFAQQYQETDLVSNSSQQKAATVDPNLVNPWGIARSTTGPWWVSDQGKGVSTIYNGSGQPAPPVLVTGGLFGSLTPVADDLLQGNDQ
jgi:hypothetical protein